MRKRLVTGTLTLAAVAIVPVVGALSVESREPLLARVEHSTLAGTETAVAASQPLVVVTPLATARGDQLPEAGSLFLVGTTLIGLAAVVRKAS